MALIGETIAGETPLTVEDLRGLKLPFVKTRVVNELRTRTRRLRIEADFASRPSLYLSGNVLNARGLRKEARHRQAIGLSSEYLDRKILKHHFGIDREAALLNHGNAEANPVQLAAGYLRLALKAGAQLRAPHDIVDLHCTRRGIELVTADGIEIQAACVVLCTGYELAKIVPPTNNRILSTWAIATGRQPEAIWPQRALIWEASEPYLYLRTTHDGRVICGGEDAEFSDPIKRDRLTDTKARRIAAKLSRLMPGYPSCYAVMGYGGNGITFSMLASKLITAALLKRKSPEARLFAFR